MEAIVKILFVLLEASKVVALLSFASFLNRYGRK
jgi:hypothetical protein